MPTATKNPAPAPEAPLDLASLRVLADHPRLAPLAAKKVALRQQLATIAAEVTRLRSQLRDAPEGSFSAATQRRTVLDDIAALERDGAALETALHALVIQIEPIENEVSGEVRAACTAESLPVFAQLIDAMEQLCAAQAAYAEASRRNRRLLGVPLLPPGACDTTLTFRLDNARQWLAKLQQRSM